MLALGATALPGLLVGCGNADSQQTQGSSLVVEADSLPNTLASDPQVVLLAARSTLETSAPGYVANAELVDVDDWETVSLAPDGFSDVDGWATRLGALGIGDGTTVIVYDDGELKFAARVRFLLEYFGVQRAELLNGGFAALGPLIDAGTLQLHADPHVPVGATFVPHISNAPIRLVEKEDVFAALGSPAVTIVDVRTPEQFDGQVTQPGDARPGHIPGAINLPIEELFTVQGTPMLLSPEVLRTTFGQVPLALNREIIMYCHDGAKSALGALALVDAGYPFVSLYYRSYEDWSQDPSLPVEE